MLIFVLLVSMLQVSSMCQVACGRKSSSEFGGPLCPTGVLSWSADGRVLVHHPESWCGLLKWGRNIDMKILLLLFLSIICQCEATATRVEEACLPIPLRPFRRRRHCHLWQNWVRAEWRLENWLWVTDVWSFLAETLQLHTTSSQSNLSPALPAGQVMFCSQSQRTLRVSSCALSKTWTFATTAGWVSHGLVPKVLHLNIYPESNRFISNLVGMQNLGKHIDMAELVISIYLEAPFHRAEQVP